MNSAARSWTHSVLHYLSTLLLLSIVACVGGEAKEGLIESPDVDIATTETSEENENEGKDSDTVLPSPVDTFVSAEDSSEVDAGDPCEQCLETEFCDNGICKPICIPDCEGKSCGEDGCGAVCGLCETSNACIDGDCIPLCNDCVDAVDCPTGFTCTSDPLGILKKRFCAPLCDSDEECPLGMECPNSGSYCVSSPSLSCHEEDVYAGNLCGDVYWLNEDCPPELPCSDTTISCSCPEENCEGRSCGTNGCETGNCGTCDPGETCVDGECCISNCVGKTCGDDGCGRICGLCPSGESCSESGQCCSPQDCGDKECGLDSFGCPCGTCGTQGECSNGQCVCEPDCEGKVCGDDGCGGSCGCCESPLICTEGICGAKDPCGGCPAGFTCAEGGRCERPSNPGCTDVIADQPLTLKGLCDDVHTVRFCENETEVILSCLAEGAKRRGGDTAEGAIWCGFVPSTGLLDCQAETPCVDTPCPAGLHSNPSGCVDGLTCGDDGTCIACSTECDALECGLNECGQPCGLCLGPFWSGELDLEMPPELCEAGSCLCTPFCEENPFPCGSDGCGGSCGLCPEGDMWSCSEERVCVCTPVCELKECGPDQCDGACGPSYPTGETTNTVIPGVSQCPGNSICGELTQQCESGSTGARCNGASGLPIIAPPSVEILGFGPQDILPPTLESAIQPLLSQGNPCSTNCAELTLRDALLYITELPESEETEDGDEDLPITWQTAHVTLKASLSSGEEAWLLTYQLDENGLVEGTSFQALFTEMPMAMDSLPQGSLSTLLDARNKAIEEKQGTSELNATEFPEAGSFKSVYWGCLPHHVQYLEIVPNLDSTLTIFVDLVTGVPLTSEWMTIEE